MKEIEREALAALSFSPTEPAVVSTSDILIAIPVIPLVPVVATWFLPWERWIPKKVPNYVLGPYLLYTAFAAWHFKAGSFTVALIAIMGGIASVSAVVKKIPGAADFTPGFRNYESPPSLFGSPEKPQQRSHESPDLSTKNGK